MEKFQPEGKDSVRHLVAIDIGTIQCRILLLCESFSLGRVAGCFSPTDSTWPYRQCRRARSFIVAISGWVGSSFMNAWTHFLQIGKPPVTPVVSIPVREPIYVSPIFQSVSDKKSAIIFHSCQIISYELISISDDDASCLPGEKAAVVTTFEWSFRVCKSVPMAATESLTDLSTEADD
jgi:hypothetical protein